MSSVTVYSAASCAEIKSILNSVEGPAVIELSDGDYGSLNLFNMSLTDGVVIRAKAGMENASFASIRLDHVKGLSFEGIKVDYVAAPGITGIRAVEVKNCADIAFHDVEFDGDLAITTSAASNGHPTGSGLYVSDSQGVTVEDSTFHTWYRGAYFSGCDDVAVSGNEFYGMRVDGIDMTAVQGVLIENNYFHDFISNGVDDGARDHRDFIQFWSTGADRPSADVTIRANVMDIGAGDWTQSIFMRNEKVDGGSAGEEMFYRDFLIEGNVIRNSHSHGITVGETAGLVIRDNVLMTGAAPEGQNFSAPQIKVAAASLDVVIADNVTERPIAVVAGWTATGNIVDVAAVDGALMQGDAAFGDASLFRFVAPDAADGLTCRWDFGDGASGTGATAVHDYAAPGDYVVTLRLYDVVGAEVDSQVMRVLVRDSQELTLGGRDGALVDLTPAGAVTDLVKLAAMTETVDGAAALRLSAQNACLAYDRASSPDMFGEQALSMSFRIKADLAGDPDGVLFRVWNGLSLGVTEDGQLKSVLVTDEGKFVAQTDGAHLLDGAWHEIELHYDDFENIMELRVDGAALGAVEASGATAAMTSWAPQFGARWGEDGFEGWISDVDIRSEVDAPVSAFATVFSTFATGTAVELRAPWIPSTAPVFQLDALDGALADVTGTGAMLKASAIAALTETVDGGPALHLTAEAPLLAFSRTACPDVYGEDDLSIGLRIKADLAGDADGVLFKVWNGMGMAVTEGGELRMYLPTTDGGVVAETSGADLLDGGWHDVMAIYSDEADELQLVVDGETLASAQVSGETAAMEYWAPQFGARWGDDGFEGWISDAAIYHEAVDTGFDMFADGLLA